MRGLLFTVSLVVGLIVVVILPILVCGIVSALAHAERARIGRRVWLHWGLSGLAIPALHYAYVGRGFLPLFVLPVIATCQVLIWRNQRSLNSVEIEDTTSIDEADPYERADE